MTVQRNIALAHLPSGTDVVLWLDDDVLLERDHVEHLVSVLADDPEQRIGGVAGIFQATDRRGRKWWHDLWERVFLLSGKEGSVLPSGINVLVERDRPRPVEVDWLYGCAAYRIEASREHWFDEGLGAYALLEDMDYSYRVGRRWRLVVNTRARLYHKRSPRGRPDQRAIERSHVRNRLRFLRRNAWSPVHLLAFVWSTLGILVLHAMTFVRTGSPEARDRVVGTLDGIALCLRGDHLLPSLGERSDT
jgi:GT2 family glycosyltransferase